MNRRKFCQMSIVAGGAAAPTSTRAEDPRYDFLLNYLCPPDNTPPDLVSPSPPTAAFKSKFFVPPLMRPQYEIGPPDKAGKDGWTEFNYQPLPDKPAVKSARRGVALDPIPEPMAHQLFDTFTPLKYYETHERQVHWKYGYQDGYEKRSASWGYQANVEADSGENLDPASEDRVPGLSQLSPSTPGPTYHARYGEPVLVRRFNDLPSIGNPNNLAPWALPSTTSHLHNGHTASESDGSPQDWIDSGEFWDHHYGNFPSGRQDSEKLTTLWYHDHRLDFTASNVYAGLAGFYFLWDELDTGSEDPAENRKLISYYKWLNDVRKCHDLEPISYDPDKAWRLPSGGYDIPMIMQDVRFFNEDAGPLADTIQVAWDALNTDGILGDQFTVNRRIRPKLPVDQRRYRFRILDGGPSRFYHLFMFHCKGSSEHEHGVGEAKQLLPFNVLTGDGNVLPKMITADSLYMSVGQRFDVVVDFAEIAESEKFEEGDKIVIVNLLEQYNGKGPSGRLFDPDPAHFDQLGVCCFEITDNKPEDLSRPISKPNEHFHVPLKDLPLRPLPEIDLTEVKHERTWDFDYDGGLWTINGLIMEPNRVDAGIEMNSAEIWRFRNTGNSWSHPVHCHFTELLMLEVNGRPYNPSYLETGVNGSASLVEFKASENPSPVTTFMGGPRRDIVTMLPGDEFKVFIRFHDFIGKHVMHCHNVVHEDHAMMIRWDMLPEGEPGFVGSKEVEEVYPDAPPFPYPEVRPPAPKHLEERPAQAKDTF